MKCRNARVTGRFRSVRLKDWPAQGTDGRRIVPRPLAPIHIYIYIYMYYMYVYVYIYIYIYITCIPLYTLRSPGKETASRYIAVCAGMCEGSKHKAA